MSVQTPEPEIPTKIGMAPKTNFVHLAYSLSLEMSGLHLKMIMIAEKLAYQINHKSFGPI